MKGGDYTLTQVKSMSLIGINGHLINVQVDVSNGIPTWDVVGLPDTSIKESKQRVYTALKNIGITLPSRKIIINLAPADLKKEGSIYDLPIAIGILCNLQIIPQKKLDSYMFIGELSLDGSLNKINGVLPMCIEAHNQGIKKVIIPYENRFEGALVKDLDIYPVKNINQIINHFNSSNAIENFKAIHSPILLNNSQNNLDFSDVKGQENIKRALEIAAAGGHNCLLIGSPGSGKTMMATRFPTILPDLSFEEALETTKIHSISGLLSINNSLITSRPFRSPHYTISKAALIGGGKNPKPR